MHTEDVGKKEERLSTGDTRKLFSEEGVYKAETISQPVPENPATYADLLLEVRAGLVHKYANHGDILDVCCANGRHLIGFAEVIKTGIGIDFSEPYLRKAYESKTAKDIRNIRFVCSDARMLPFCSNHFDLTYSFSSLYIIPNVRYVIYEIARILKPGGKCILDLGNFYSLNKVVSSVYHKDLGWAEPFPISVAAMKRAISKAGLNIVEYRAFQILPLWGADRPKWLRIFLLPFWTQLLSRRVKGKILDEWISNLPVFRFFAFRHIFVCEKV